MPYCFPQQLHHFTVLSAIHKDSSVFPFSPLFCFVFLIIAIVIGVKGYLTELFVCLSLITNNTEHLFIYSLAICVSFWRNVNLNLLLILGDKQKLIWVFLLLLSCMSSLYIQVINPLINLQRTERQDVFPFVSVFFNFFQQCFVIFSVQVFHLHG